VTVVDTAPKILVSKTPSSPAVPEPSGAVTFTVQVDNTSNVEDPVTIDSLTDDIHGDLNGQGTCAVPQVIAPAGSYSCAFEVTLSGNAGHSETDTVTASGQDDEAAAVVGSDSATVTVADVAPAITVTKTPSTSTVPEPSGPVTFTVRVDNTSHAQDPVTIDTLTDDVHGDLNGRGTCTVPQLIAPAGSYQCAFTATVAGNTGDVETDTVTASGQDDDGAPVNASDDAAVTVVDTAPSIGVVKTASPSTVPEPSGLVSFTVRVNNTSNAQDPVTIDSLTDDVHGDLNGQGTCAVPRLIQPSSFYECSFSATVAGNAGDSETDTVTASGQDDDGAAVNGTDSVTVTVTDAAPTIAVTKTPSTPTVPEPSGEVTFTVQVDNTSHAEDPVTIDTLSDTIYGDLLDLTDEGGTAKPQTGTTCVLPQVIPPASSYQCTFTATVAGNAGDSETNLVTASGEDDEATGVVGSGGTTVTVLDSEPSIVVSKTADPDSVSEPGASVTFTVEVDNTSNAQDPVTITSLVDDVYGSLNGQGSCSVPQAIASGASYGCSFSAQVAGNAGETPTDTVTASGTDDEGTPVGDSDSATVTVTGVAPVLTVAKTVSPQTVSEPSGSVVFTVRVDNDSVAGDPVTVDSLTDDVYGDLNGQGTCSVPQVIQPGGFYRCTFPATISGNAGDTETDTVTASGRDDEESPGSDSDSATVTVTGAAPSIQVTKTAAPESLPEPGGTVTFTIQIDNTSGSSDPVEITSLTDSIHGDLNGRGSCLVPQAIQPGASYGCSFDATVSGNAGDVETDTVTASGTDDDGAGVGAMASATVTLTDAPPALAVVKTASPTSVDEPAGEVTFTIEVTNDSVDGDPVTITSLTDDIHGTLDGQGSCALPQTIQPGETYSCSFGAQVAGNAGDTETDTVTASGQDDEGNPVSDSDSATVTLDGVEPSISVIKSAPASVAEPGGAVTFTVRVDNDSSAEDPVTIDTLADDVYGDLTDITDEGGTVKPQTSTTCALPQTIQPGESYPCSFVADVNGNVGFQETDTVTASGEDDDGVAASAGDSATVTVSGVAPTVTVIKSALPTTVAEPGGEVSFSVQVRNDSHDEDPVTLASLVDSIHGDLAGRGDCATPQSLDPGQSYSCSFTAQVSGNDGEVETDTVTATGTDDEGVAFSASDDASVTITPTAPQIALTKTATPGLLVEPGGTVIFTVRIDNLSNTQDPVTITSLTDDLYGDLADLSTEGGTAKPQLGSTCTVPRTIQPGGFTQCSFSAEVIGNTGDSETDLVTASGADDDGAEVSAFDSATVEVVDGVPLIAVTKTAAPLTVPEPGAAVTFSLQVENQTGANDPVTIDSLMDSVFGNVADAANPALQSTTCSVPQPIQPGATYACSFIAEVTGNAGEIEIDLVTASGVDDDDTPVSDSATATVTVTGVPPAITVSKSAVPISLPEPGGSVTFTVRVDNASTAEDPVTIDSLSDTVYGDLTDVGDEGGTAKGQTGTSCILPQTIPPGQFYECAFSSQVTGNKDFTETNTITASGQDDDGVATSAGASATVTITGADPSVVVTKTATPMLLPEPGGTVTFMITVENSSQTTDPVTLTALDDDVYGDLTEIGDEGGAAKPQMSTTCVLPQTIQPAATWGCSFTAEVTGAAGFSETDTVTASGADDESVAVVGNDSATVTVTDLPPSIAVAKMAAPASLDEPGGAVTFTVRIDNTSGQGDEVTITSLTDDVYGDLTDPSDERTKKTTRPPTAAAPWSRSTAWTRP
jgi:hypothetical protein